MITDDKHYGEQAWLIIAYPSFRWVVLDNGEKYRVPSGYYHLADTYIPEKYIDTKLTNQEQIYGKGFGRNLKQEREQKLKKLSQS